MPSRPMRPSGVRSLYSSTNFGGRLSRSKPSGEMQLTNTPLGPSKPAKSRVSPTIPLLAAAARDAATRVMNQNVDLSVGGSRVGSYLFHIGRIFHGQRQWERLARIK